MPKFSIEFQNLLEVKSITQKRLDDKTIRAYRNDIGQFCREYGNKTAPKITSDDIERYVAQLHRQFKPKTVKRKVASLKTFFSYLEYREITERNPFARLRLKFREPVILPRTIPLYYIECLLRIIYQQQSEASTQYRRMLNHYTKLASIELHITPHKYTELVIRCIFSAALLDFSK